jgi:hypothetical protein
MWYATVLSAVIILAILIDEDILRIEKRMYWSWAVRYVLVFHKYEVAYWHHNNASYNELVLCLRRLHFSYYSHEINYDEDYKPKIQTCVTFLEGKVFEEDWAYGLLRLAVGIERSRGLNVEIVNSTTWIQEDALESVVNIKHL